MLYFLAFVFPPLAVLLCGKPFQALFLSPVLTIACGLPGMIHAFCIVSEYHQREHLVRFSALVSDHNDETFEDMICEGCGWYWSPQSMGRPAKCPRCSSWSIKTESEVAGWLPRNPDDFELRGEPSPLIGSKGSLLGLPPHLSLGRFRIIMVGRDICPRTSRRRSPGDSWRKLGCISERRLCGNVKGQQRGRAARQALSGRRCKHRVDHPCDQRVDLCGVVRATLRETRTPATLTPRYSAPIVVLHAPQQQPTSPDVIPTLESSDRSARDRSAKPLPREATRPPGRDQFDQP